MKQFFRKLWYAERQQYFPQGQEPMVVDFSAGEMRMKFAGKQRIMGCFFLFDGRTIGVVGEQEIRIELSAHLPAPAIGLRLMADPVPLVVEDVTSDGLRMLAQSNIPLETFLGAGYFTTYVPRWRLFWDGLCNALRWKPIRMEKMR